MKKFFCLFTLFLTFISISVAQKVVFNSAQVDGKEVKNLRVSITTDSVKISGVFDGKILSIQRKENLTITCLDNTEIVVSNSDIKINGNEKATVIKFLY